MAKHRFVIDFDPIKKRFILLDQIRNKSAKEFNSMNEAANYYRVFIKQLENEI